MSAVTVDLLDSMLSPTPGQPASEALYRSIPLPNRVRELTSLLGQLNGSNNNANNVVANNNAGRIMLAAVLLRRDISTLAGAETMTGLPPSASMALMGEVAEPLMALFTNQQQQQQQQSRRQIGHCIAELCGSLSVVSGEHGREWMTSVLGRLEPGVSDDVHQLLYEDISMSTA